MTPQARPLTARCPECDSRIYFDRPPDIGQILACPECETSLEVIGANPVKLDWAYDEGDRFISSTSSREERFDEFEREERSFFDEEDDDWS
jgi:lysine biosynthesis protein LysW